MTEYDLPWKEVLDAYLKDFLELCLPEVHAGIDWNSPIENHEQELPHLFPKSLTAGRVADKLFRAKFLGSEQPTWFMIHTEVQVARQADFAQRMFTCYYRILDRFEEPVVCIGIIGDGSKSWRPKTWEVDVLGCQLRFSYPIVKLQDFTDEIERLNISRNPFATVIASHLRAQASAGNPNVRFGFKVDLVRSLYEKQWQADQVRKLFRFIDWVMDLPETLEIQFMDTVKKIETEKEMTYVTSIERIARREGKAEGNIQLLQELLGIPVSSDTELEQMDAERLQALLKELRQSFDSRAGKQGS
jgi:hypothetical protein